MHKEYAKKVLPNQIYTATMVLEFHVRVSKAVLQLMENATALARTMDKPLCQMEKTPKNVHVSAQAESLPAVFHKNKSQKNKKRSV